MQKHVKAAYYRGGTSKGIFFHKNDLLALKTNVDQAILAVFGSPDPNKRQLDGMGGATSSTSKVVIISPSKSEDHDIDYYFGQVGIDKPFVDYQGNCGNLSSAVGPFAIDEGLVYAEEPITQVRIFQVNTQKTILAEVPVKDGRYNEEGNCSIDGIPGTGGRILLRFLNPAGSKTGRLLPTGSPLDRLELQGLGNIEVSIVDAANPIVFVRATDIGLTGNEIDDSAISPAIHTRLEAIRRQAAVMLGFAPTPEQAGETFQAIPKVVFVSQPQGYLDTSGRKIDARDMDITARVLSMGALHKAIAVTAAICTAGAAKIPGTIVQQLARTNAPDTVRLGHPGGLLTIEARMQDQNGQSQYLEAVMERTARRIMDGRVMVPSRFFEAP